MNTAPNNQYEHSFAREIQRQASLLSMPCALFIFIPALVIFVGSLLLLATCPDSGAEMSLCSADNKLSVINISLWGLLALASFFSVVALRQLKSWAVITNFAITSVAFILLMLKLISVIYIRVFVDENMGFEVNFSSLIAVASLAVVLFFAGMLIWYPSLMFYRHIVLRSIWLHGKLTHR